MKRTSYAYAGIGSRRTPDDVLLLIEACAARLCAAGWTMRSGAAEGADTAFENGCMGVELKRCPRTEVYLPWPNFNGHGTAALDRATEAAFPIAAKYHPVWFRLRPGARRLHARNVHQILGRDLNDPVLMVVCWTPDGTLDGEGPDSGGTGMALRIVRGEAPDAVVFNLARPEHRTRIERFVDKDLPL